MNKNIHTLNHIDHFFKMIKTLRVVILILLGVITLLSTLFINLALKDPIVITEKVDNTRIYTWAKRRKIEVGISEISHFTESFIEERYSWDRFSSELVIKKIGNWITPQYKKSLLAAFKKRKPIKDKKISQYVANIQIKIDGSVAHAKFDRVIRVNGIPLISPMQVTLYLIRGDQDKFNLYGLYIKGVEEYEVN